MGLCAPKLRREASDRDRVSGTPLISPEVEMTASDWCSRKAARPFALGVILATLLLRELTLLLRRLETDGRLSLCPLPRLAAPLPFRPCVPELKLR